MNPYDTLGIPRGSSKEDAKKAFRKFAMEFHPDRLAGKSDKEKADGEAKFKQYKEAMESIERGETNGPPPKGFSTHTFTATDMDEILRGFQSMHRKAPIQKTISLNLQTAFNGGKVPLNVGSTSVGFNVPAGVPHMSTIEDEVPTEGGNQTVHVLINIKDPKFSFKSDERGRFLNGDLECTVDVPASTLLLGGHIVVEDFLGAKLQVRVPQGFNPKHTLKVSKRGYAAWQGTMNWQGTRGDLYVHVNPIRSTIAEMTMDEHQAIEKAIQDYYKSISTQPLDERA